MCSRNSDEQTRWAARGTERSLPSSTSPPPRSASHAYASTASCRSRKRARRQPNADVQNDTRTPRPTVPGLLLPPMHRDRRIAEPPGRSPQWPLRRESARLTTQSASITARSETGARAARGLSRTAALGSRAGSTGRPPAPHRQDARWSIGKRTAGLRELCDCEPRARSEPGRRYSSCEGLDRRRRAPSPGALGVPETGSASRN